MSENTELHEGVKLLTARMESHPEEFNGVGTNDMVYESMYGSARWTRVIHEYWKVLTEYEKAVITTSLREANRKNFHSAVMKTILAPDEELIKRQSMGMKIGQGVYPQQMELPGIPTLNEAAYGPASITSYNTIK